MAAISGPSRAVKLNVTVQDKLKNINCPTLIIHGREDFIVAAAPELVHRLVSNSKLVVIPDSGHYPFIEQPDAFSKTLRRFITGTVSTN